MPSRAGPSELLIELLCKWCEAMSDGRVADAEFFAREAQVGAEVLAWHPRVRPALERLLASTGVPADAVPSLVSALRVASVQGLGPDGPGTGPAGPAPPGAPA